MFTVVRSAPRLARLRVGGLLTPALDMADDVRRGIVSIEGVQGSLTDDLSVGDARAVLSRAREYQSRGPSIQGVQGDVAAVLGLASRGGLYGSPQARGYASNAAAANHHQLSSQQGAQARVYDEEPLGEPGAQGIQGDNCVTFKLWMENCQKYHLPNCDDQLAAVASGKKTLAQVFAEQESIIREVAETYWKQQADVVDSVDVQGVQTANFDIVSDTAPCPQGVQGSDCANFKIWAHNCQEFGFGHCADRLQDVAEGHRSLRDIFDEQEKLIQQIVAEHKLTEASSPDVSR